MELNFFEDRNAIRTNHKLPLSAWQDRDDQKGIISIDKKRMRKLLGGKNSQNLGKGKFNEKISRYSRSFVSSENVVSNFTSTFNNVIDSKLIKSEHGIISRIHLKTTPNSATVSRDSKLLVSSYKSCTLYALKDEGLCVLSDLSMKLPYTKGAISHDAANSLFYANMTGLAIFNHESNCVQNHTKSKDIGSVNDLYWNSSKNLITCISDSSKGFFLDDRIFKPISSLILEGASSVVSSQCGIYSWFGMKNGSVNVFDLRANDVVETHKTDYGEIRKLCHFSSGRVFAGHSSGYISIVGDTSANSTRAKVIENHVTSITDIDFNDSSSKLLTCSFESRKSAKLFDVDSFKCEHLSNSIFVPSRVLHSKFVSNDCFTLLSRDSLTCYRI